MLYQINTRLVLREIGPNATLDDLPDALFDDLATRGIEHVWMLGVWQTGPAGREVSRTNAEWLAGYRALLPDLRDDDITGSPFAVRAYTVHADFGGDEALARLRQRLHRRGLKLLLDFVPNHVALDHPWVQQHPEWFIHGSTHDLAREPQNWARVGDRILAHGRDPYFPGWPDTLQLNYFHPGLREAMRDQLLAIASRCDGVRCDMAMLLLPDVFRGTWGEAAHANGVRANEEDFWPWAIATLPANFLLLAEVYWDLEWALQRRGFHFTYDKRLLDRLRTGRVSGVRAHLGGALDFQRRSARFLENHDEARAASAFDLARHRAAAVVTYLLPGLRFFHEGQWQGRKAHASIHLGRRPIEPIDGEIQTFYDRLLPCLGRPELLLGAWRLCPCNRAWANNPTAENFLAWRWQTEAGGLLVAVNYGPTQGQCYVGLEPEVAGHDWELRDLLSDAAYQREGDDLAHRGLYLDLPAWGYHVFAMSAR